MIFFADENISSRTVDLLEVFDGDHEVRAHRRLFEPGIADIEWLQEIAKWNPKPAVLSGDGRILHIPAELTALEDSGVTFVHLARRWTNHNWETYAWKIIKCWPDIVRNVSSARLPTLF